MNATLSPPKLTPEDLLQLPDDGRSYELVNGELQELPVSKESSRLAGEVHFALRTFTAAYPIGWVFPEGTAYRCFEGEPGTVRKPDTSFITLERMPLDGYED